MAISLMVRDAAVDDCAMCVPARELISDQQGHLMPTDRQLAGF